MAARRRPKTVAARNKAELDACVRRLEARQLACWPVPARRHGGWRRLDRWSKADPQERGSRSPAAGALAVLAASTTGDDGG